MGKLLYPANGDFIVIKPCGVFGLVLIVFSLWCGNIVAQQLKYDVILMGDKVGETIITMKDSAGFKLYTLRNTTDIKLMFWHKKSQMATEVIYDPRGVLLSSVCNSIKDEVRTSTKTNTINGKLLVEKDGKQSTLSGVATYSTLSFYYMEPTNIKRVYSERLGEFFELKKEANGKYSAQTAGNSAVYTYLNGKLTQLEMKSTLGSLLMRLAK